MRIAGLILFSAGILLNHSSLALLEPHNLIAVTTAADAKMSAASEKPSPTKVIRMTEATQGN